MLLPRGICNVVTVLGPLKPNGNAPPASTIKNIHLYLCVSYDSHCKQRLFPQTALNQLIFVMVKSCVFFALRTEFLNIIQMSFGFKGLKCMSVIN
jgi:hypothetical protein